MKKTNPKMKKRMEAVRNKVDAFDDQPYMSKRYDDISLELPLGMIRRWHNQHLAIFPNGVAYGTFYMRLINMDNIKEAITTPHQGHGGDRSKKYLKEDELMGIIDDLYIEEYYDELNQDSCPENALSETYYRILEMLPDGVNEETPIKSRYSETVKDYIIDGYDTSLCFNSLFKYY